MLENSSPNDASARGWTKKSVLRPMLSGFILGSLTWVTAAQLGVGMFIRLPFIDAFSDLDWFLVIIGVFWGLLFISRWRSVAWTLSGATVIAYLLIAFTPLSLRITHGLVHSDPLQPCPVIQVLGSGVRDDGTLDGSGEDRLETALDLVGDGYGKHLIISRMPEPHPSARGDVERQIGALRLHTTLDEIGPVSSTHDEAMQGADLARRRGWGRALVVTSPLQTSRARATFRKAGLDVIVYPCIERGTDLAGHSASARLEIWREALRERAAEWMYHRRGWI